MSDADPALALVLPLPRLPLEKLLFLSSCLLLVAIDLHRCLLEFPAWCPRTCLLGSSRIPHSPLLPPAELSNVSKLESTAILSSLLSSSVLPRLSLGRVPPLPFLSMVFRQSGCGLPAGYAAAAGNLSAVLLTCGGAAAQTAWLYTAPYAGHNRNYSVLHLLAQPILHDRDGRTVRNLTQPAPSRTCHQSL